MNDAVRKIAVGLLIFAACIPAEGRAQFREDLDLAAISLSGTSTESIILLWPTFSYRLARLMIARYGQPAEATDHKLVWRDNVPWKTTVVYRTPPERVFRRSRGRLEQSVGYPVPADKLGSLTLFDKDIEADPKEGRLTVRSDDETENFLTLNLAHDVLKGRRTAKEASDFRRELSRLRDAGKSSSYLGGLLFVGGD